MEVIIVKSQPGATTIRIEGTHEETNNIVDVIMEEVRKCSSTDQMTQ